MPLPMVAIVGRPNVGKSSLFNALVGRRASIVDATPGVTRDRVSEVCDYDGVYFELIDTGGYGIDDADDLTDQIGRQIHVAINRADLVLFLVDTRAGMVPLDVKMADMLRTHHGRVRLIANKTDDESMVPQAAEFARLGFGEPLCVSAAHALGKGDIREMIVESLRARALADKPPVAPGVDKPPEAPDAGGALVGPPVWHRFSTGESQVANLCHTDPVMKIAVVGKRNTGKSTFINALAGEERVIVSEVAGTTRDAVDVRFEKDGRAFLAIDTAGVRKRSKIADAIEFYALTRMQRSIERADVVLFLTDATEPISHVDKNLAKTLVEAFKPVVLIVNKWDLAKARTSTEQYGEYLTKVLPGLEHAPISFVSAKDGRNVYTAIDVASSLFKQYHARVGTGRLNQALKTALSERGPATKRGPHAPRVFYATQVGTAPPTIVLFVNHVSRFAADYQRFLVNRFQALLPFGEVPIRLVLRPRSGYGDAVRRRTGV